MICTSIQHKNLEEILELVAEGDSEMAEIRLDLCPELSEEDIESLFADTDIPLVATCRYEQCPDAEKRLAAAIRAGAAFVDLEVEMPSAMGKRLRRLAKESGTTVIRSWHDFEQTPSVFLLHEQLELCRTYGADIAKIVTTARDAEDVERVQALYDEAEEGKLIAFCMGEAGRESRLEALAKGAPYTYAALSEEDAVASGQWAAAAMRSALYGSRKPYRRTGVRIPCSKSFAQRAIIAAALSDGTSHLSAYSACADNEAAIRVAKELGAEVEESSPVEGAKVLTIKGAAAASAPDRLFVGESGLLTRLMIPLLAAHGNGATEITGEKTLTRRPLSGANDIMAAFGVTLTNLGEGREIHVPLRINGHLIPGRAEVSGKGGSQLISGLLMALPLCEGGTDLYVTEPRSIPYMFITQDVLQKFGVKISSEMEGDEEFMETRDWAYCTGLHFKIRGGQKYKAADIDLEGDWSSAAALLVAGAVFGRAEISGLDTRSLQADLTIMDILVEAGASVSQVDTDFTDAVGSAAAAAGVAPSRGVVSVAKAPLSSFDVDLNHAPDLFPVTAVLACFCPGQSRISGVGRLAGKESDRAAAIKEMLEQLGVAVSIEGDDMLIEGQAYSTRLLGGTLLHGGKFTSHHDHRMVMALRVAELGADGPIEIDDTECVAKSFPDFEKVFAGEN
jgi:3-phosphoshikimate 1-carboxyvinyltransferase